MVDQISKALLRIVSQSDGYAKAQRAAVSELFQAVVSILPRIDTLVRRADFTMSDSITIQAVFIAIGPFFVADPTADGKNSKGSIIISTLGGPAALRGLNLSALSLIRSVRDLSMTVSRFLTVVQLFANNEEQRAWIIEEILTSLIKIPDLKHKGGQFRSVVQTLLWFITDLLEDCETENPYILFQLCYFSSSRLHRTCSAMSATSSLSNVALPRLRLKTFCSVTKKERCGSELVSI